MYFWSPWFSYISYISLIVRILSRPLGQAHESVSQFAQAYALGEKESNAAVNLLRHIPPSIKDSLTELVRILGFELIGTHLGNYSFCNGSPMVTFIYFYILTSSTAGRMSEDSYSAQVCQSRWFGRRSSKPWLLQCIWVPVAVEILFVQQPGTSEPFWSPGWKSIGWRCRPSNGNPGMWRTWNLSCIPHQTYVWVCLNLYNVSCFGNRIVLKSTTMHTKGFDLLMLSLLRPSSNVYVVASSHAWSSFIHRSPRSLPIPVSLRSIGRSWS